ncbi:tRNA threonylcarbamoyladenosine dehydratase [Ferrigenium kumadai]|uniref:tRNA threonylcarbamoyladenosine dehydratase n=1 Tax=Ferrigenium kumadai TaxID=1682490 RepID=A0AAN1T0E2_9PROT|nr:tRNA threonylcarbamoyladenosine dehydratase [Ferrigenium kumadai]BBJ00408.1 tRNA threonylcarbamoyladenosine dehydratase [Ferrigenium kumadai]
MQHHHPLDDEHDRRFGGLDRLYGEGSRLALHRSRVAVVGVGGVGSWAVEALARSGIGNITLIDFDHVAVSNVNRQIQALSSTLGEAKVSALEARIRDINPDCRVNAVDDFLTVENLPQLIPAGAFDAVIDACDEAKVKAALIVHARFNKIPLVVCGAAGGKRDPLKLRCDDLGRTTHDALLSRIRNMLRKDFNIQPRKNGKFGVACVYLEEPSKRSTSCSASDLSCSGYGSAVTVTASMGFAAAAWCLERIVAQQNPEG